MERITEESLDAMLDALNRKYRRQGIEFWTFEEAGRLRCAMDVRTRAEDPEEALSLAVAASGAAYDLARLRGALAAMADMGAAA